MNALITGSHAYGTPTPESDVDLAILVSAEDWKTLQAVAVQSEQDVNTANTARPQYSNPLSMRFGKLNLLITTDEGWFAVWRDGTEKLKQIKPVDRDVAVSLFSELREKRKQEIIAAKEPDQFSKLFTI